jgi:hypothetical protein
MTFGWKSKPSAPEQQGPEPLLAHVHVPKTAGSSVRKVLDQIYGPAHVHLYFDHATTFVYEDGQLADLVKPLAIKAFSSHFVRRFPPKLAARQVKYVTFLRDPVQQFISYITYVRKHFESIHDPVLLSHLPPGMSHLSVRECVSWILQGKDSAFRNFRENYNTNFFARYPMLDSKGLDYADARYRSARQGMARQVLSRFLMVGITERMDDSWRLLCARAKKVGIELPPVSIPVENVTAGERDSLEWIHMDDAVGRQLLASVQEDLQLYRWALTRFESMAEQTSETVGVARSFVNRLLPARWAGTLLD